VLIYHSGADFGLRIFMVIKAENLSKLYYLGGSSHNSLRDALAGFIKNPKRDKKRELWALRDVSFEVKDGETLGIIGKNGAGKSTLLKILSRITKPTSGKVEIYGRVGSLLEVGTGFHNELTGRENIFLNGAILGMKRAEIEKKFDEIVAFSEIEKFLDTPVKHYSSGMYMRLAFAVAAHLEPEILIVDEVLAVGDIAFQKKCLRKMRDVGESGRTVLFVSHDMQAVGRLCSRAIWIKDGQIARNDKTPVVVGAYLREQSEKGTEKIWKDATDAPGNEFMRLRKVRVRDEKGNVASVADIGSPVGIEITYQILQDEKIITPTFHLYNEQGICVFVSFDQDKNWRYKPRKKGIYVSTAWIPANFLAEGTMFVTVIMATFEPLAVHLIERDAVTFRVTDKIKGDSARGNYVGEMPGVVRPILEWETEFKGDSF
jgi:lipopolysaccharide transport system ATP-binding protein